MISKIIPGSVLAPERQTYEKIIRVACGVNDQWKCNPDGSSVAEQISRLYQPEFAALWEWKLWDIHKRSFEIDGVAAEAIGIVCNILDRDADWRDDSSDWAQAVPSVEQWFENIVQNISFSMTPWEPVQDLKQKLAQISMNSDVFSTATNTQKALDEFNNRINPIVRSVLIGSWRSGFNNDANVAGILQAMHSSHANIHLYLQAEEQMARVAKVVPKFPEIWAIAAVEGYDEYIKVVV